MSRRAVDFTGAQLRAITADKLRYGYFLLAVLSVLAVSLTFSAPDPAVDLQRDVFRARTVLVSVISHAVDTTAAFAWQTLVEREPALHPNTRWLGPDAKKLMPKWIGPFKVEKKVDRVGIQIGTASEHVTLESVPCVSPEGIQD